MPLWILLTLAAAFLQNVRSSLQKYLKSRMGTTGATFVRFGFGMPFVCLLVAVLHYYFGYAFPPIQAAFLMWIVVGGLSQIGATFLLVHLFSFRNFAVGTAYSRTEAAQAALFGLVFLSESISIMSVVAVAICVVGVMLISLAREAISIQALLTSLSQRTAVFGLLSGAGFGFSAIAYRGASLSLGGPNFFMQASVTLAFAISFQTLVMLFWIVLKEPQQLSMIGKAWRPSLLVGLSGASASLGWFTAMTIQNAAIVQAVGKVELLFAMATSALFFKEKMSLWEFIGCLFIAAGVVLLIVWR